ncbi:MAG TPA: MerR family transcriptional regulator [Chthonomonadaceae bacterium]|nr:MerR family transcriptional regulator [Chthonomonadaceae bacterium]
MDEERFSIGELATAAATTPRTIRFYTTEGLLPPPLTEGRNAIYSQAHRRRLRLIQRLKAAFLPLSAIKDQMAGLTDSQVEGLLERAGPHRVENTGPPHVPRAVRPPAGPESDAVAYVAQVLAVAEQAPPVADARAEAKRVLLISPALRANGDSDGVSADPAPLIRSDRWERIALAPGIELHVREDLSPERRAGLYQLVQLARLVLPESAE